MDHKTKIRSLAKSTGWELHVKPPYFWHSDEFWRDDQRIGIRYGKKSVTGARIWTVGVIGSETITGKDKLSQVTTYLRAETS